MESETKRLENEISNEMYNKLGMKISLVDFYESILRKIISKEKGHFDETKKIYDEQIKGKSYKLQIIRFLKINFLYRN